MFNVNNLTNQMSSLLTGVKDKVRGTGPETPEPEPVAVQPVVENFDDGSGSDHTEGPDSNPGSPMKDGAPITDGVSQKAAAAPPRPPPPVHSKSIDATKLAQAEDNPTADPNQEGATAAKQIGEASTKAINSAKEWGNYFTTNLFSIGKAAGEQVATTATKIKRTVEEKTILGDFSREQDKFVDEQKDKQKGQDVPVALWVGYDQEEDMKKQIIALSSDQRNFTRNPPSGIQFNFNYNNSQPVAMVMLKEDPTLEEMRFNLVPKQLKEEIFWRNYFYRVSLVKQSAELSSLAQQTESSKDGKDSRKSNPVSMVRGSGEEELVQSSPPDHEFVSDTYQQDGLNRDELRQEMQQLGMTNKIDDDVPDWERELQEELQEYEVVADDDANEDADLENEIMQQIAAEEEEDENDLK